MRITKILAVLAAFLLLVAACGSDDGIDLVAANPVEDTESTDDSADSGDDAEAPDDSADPVDEPPVDESDSLAETSDDDLPILGGGGTLATVDITITHPDEADVVYTISCLGDTATIIGDVGLDAFAACDQLGDETVRDRLINGPNLERVCSQIDGGPDLATIVGTYDGVDGPVVDTTIDRRNGCTIDEWDVLLSAILPPAAFGF